MAVSLGLCIFAGENCYTGMVNAKLIQDFDSLVAALFPPHPLAASPSDELGAFDGAPKVTKRFFNKHWGRIKQEASRRNNSKTR